MYKDLIDNLKPELDKTVEFLKKEFLKITTSRATPAMVEDIEIDCYDQKMPIKQLANISAPQPRLITIDPWDKSILPELEKGIRQNSSFNPVVDSDIIRIGPPHLGGETHFNCRCHYDMVLETNPAFAKVQRMLKAVKVILAITAVKKHKQELMVRKS